MLTFLGECDVRSGFGSSGGDSQECRKNEWFPKESVWHNFQFLATCSFFLRFCSNLARRYYLDFLLVTNMQNFSLRLSRNGIIVTALLSWRTICPSNLLRMCYQGNKKESILKLLNSDKLIHMYIFRKGLQVWLNRPFWIYIGTL